MLKTHQITIRKTLNKKKRNMNMQIVKLKGKLRNENNKIKQNLQKLSKKGQMFRHKKLRTKI